MATKVLLNSGGMRLNEAKSREYYLELLRGLGESPRLLICYFAQPREVWEAKFEDIQGTISRLLADDALKPKLELAMPDTFKQQVVSSDAIHIPGGDDHLVQYWLAKYDIKKLFKNKSVGGSSAGANALALASWTCDWRTSIEGLGLVNVAFIPHYNSKLYAEDDPRGPIDWELAKHSLADYAPTLEIYSPEESDFVVFNQ